MSHARRDDQPKVVLVGAPGSGKTTVGRLLAAHLGTGFIESDDLIARAAGLDSAAAVLTEQGEDAFRAWEVDAARTAVTAPESQGAVVALSSGAVTNSEVRGMLAEVPVVWLRVTAANAASRVGLNAIRPVALGNIRAQFSTQLKARTPFYAEVSATTVDTDHRSFDDIVADILAWLESDQAEGK